MEFIDLSLKDYNLLLASDAPAPGGGAASALAGAQGIGLTLMVINLTLGKEKYAEFEPLCTEIKNCAEELLQDFLAGIDRDKEVFTALMEAYKLPKSTDDEKNRRSLAVNEATEAATEVPFSAMEQGVRGLELTLPLIGKSNKGAVSDLGVAAVNLLSCVKGAWLNVVINLPGIKDEKMAENFKKTGEAYISQAEALADEIYSRTVDAIRG